MSKGKRATKENTERAVITFRLRDVDADLQQATKDIDGKQLASLARDGLRLMLGITTTKRVQVVDVPIRSAVVSHEQQRTMPQSQTATRTIGNQGRPLIQSPKS
jgi:hypothetical protein